jgi:hypothetical protein
MSFQFTGGVAEGIEVVTRIPPLLVEVDRRQQERG